MKVLNPITVLCTAHQFIDPEMNAQITKYPFQFILKADGKIMRRFQASTGKWLSVEVPSIANVTDPFAELGIARNTLIPTDALAENLDFLPAGKIPVTMLHQIIAFFKAVMSNKLASHLKTNYSQHSYEAMIFIVYNPTTGYRLAVPTQRVSAASVSYDHDCYDLAAGDVVVVDIHSHNTMGAFFSGTDNRDDKASICYSGVIGKLNTSSPEIKFRLNVQDKKYDIGINEIFREDNIVVPEEWMDKVSVMGTQYSGNGYGNWGNANRQGGFGSGQGRFPVPYAGFEDIDEEDEAQAAFYRELWGADPSSEPVGATPSRYERRLANKVKQFTQNKGFGSAIPQTTNPAMKHLTQSDFEADLDTADEINQEVLTTTPEFFNHIMFDAAEYPSLAVEGSVALFAIIGGLSEDFYISGNNEDDTAPREVGHYTGQVGVRYSFSLVYREKVARVFLSRRNRSLASENEIMKFVRDTQDDAWKLFSNIQVSA